VNGAYASFEENVKGSIEVGKLADLVVLASDPTQIDPMGIKDIEVEQTILGGKVVYGG
nr:amidohydrolase family protein [Dehalococcoidia bacterium]